MKIIGKDYPTMKKIYKIMAKSLKKCGYDVWYSNKPDTFVVSVDDVDVLAVKFKIRNFSISTEITDTKSNMMMHNQDIYSGIAWRSFIKRIVYRIVVLLSSSIDIYNDIPWTEQRQ